MTILRGNVSSRHYGCWWLIKGKCIIWEYSYFFKVWLDAKQILTRPAWSSRGFSELFTAIIPQEGHPIYKVRRRNANESSKMYRTYSLAKGESNGKACATKQPCFSHLSGDTHARRIDWNNLYMRWLCNYLSLMRIIPCRLGGRSFSSPFSYKSYQHARRSLSVISALPFPLKVRT